MHSDCRSLHATAGLKLGYVWDLQRRGRQRIRSGAQCAAALLLALVMLGSAGCKWLAEASPRPPDEPTGAALRETIALDESFSYSAGEVLAGQPLRHVFHYRNDTSSTLRRSQQHSIQTTCGCTRVQLNETQLRPGGSAELSIEIQTDNRLGEVSESATVTWSSEAGESRHCQFTLSGRVISAFAFDPPELTFTKEDLRRSRRQRVRCRSDLPIDWERVELRADEPYVFIEEQQVEPNSGGLIFAVSCRPTHRGDHRQTAIHVSGATSEDLATGKPPYRAVLPVFSQDFAPLRIAPLLPVFQHDAARAAWSGYVILSGDLIERGTRTQTISAKGCDVEFTTLDLGETAQRLNITLQGPVDALQPDQRKLQLTFDNGLRQSLDFRLVTQ